MKKIAQQTKESSKKLMLLNEEKRIKALEKIAETLMTNAELIMRENAKDIKQAEDNNLEAALIDRLKLDLSRIKNMSEGCLAIARFPQVIQTVEEKKKKENGLIIQKERIPLGVILMIFESRPNVIVDSAALAIKSGNALILKGGKEAAFSNKILGELVHEATKEFIPKECLVVLDSTDRQAISELLELRGIIDLVIPRGGEKLIHYVYEHSKIPVIAHYKGLCHIYIDDEVDSKIACPIVLNAKTQRPGVCNAMETLLYHQNASKKMMQEIFKSLKEEGVTLYADEKTVRDFSEISFEKANAESYFTEYLSLNLSVKSVKNIDEAITHIKAHGSNHTEAILSENTSHIEKFKNAIDASVIAVNASTRFNDGGELGLGAELGISTSKLHSYGPMGAKEMTTTRYILKGNGQIRN